MKKYLIVWHNYWMDSKYFEYKIIKGSYKLAEIKAKVYRSDKESMFHRCDYKIIPLADNVRLRKLSFKERFLGKIIND